MPLTISLVTHRPVGTEANLAANWHMELAIFATLHALARYKLVARSTRQLLRVVEHVIRLELDATVVATAALV